MPFGSHEGGFGDKTFIEDDNRFRTFDSLAVAAE
jgi:predicted oxidoreductase (fatty acid repression mutant protein)